MNDLQSILGECQYQLYADDTVIYCSNESNKLAEKELQTKLKLFSKWCKINKLTVNTNKTKVMAFGSKFKVKNITKPELYLTIICCKLCLHLDI